MTTLARISGVRGAVTEHRGASPPDGTHVLPARLREESDRQVPFSHARLLLREAASAIERLEAEVARITADPAGVRATGPTL